jgi:hypothetical protein
MVRITRFFLFDNCNLEIVASVAANVHALAMAGQFITFRRNVCPVNEQKVEIFILMLNREFSVRNYGRIANKKLMKCTSRPANANAM